MSDLATSEIVLCVPGHFASEDAVRALIPSLEFELEAHEPRMLEAFAASAVGEVDLAELETVAAHTSVLYVLSGAFTEDDAQSVALAMLAAGCALLDAGGLGVKCESSGIAHTPAAWRQLHTDASEAFDLLEQPDLDDDAKPLVRERLAVALYDAYVLRPLGDDDDIYTCGMHLLGAPDVVVATNVILSDGNEDVVDTTDLDTFALHVLANPGARDREIFRTADDATPYVVRTEPCTRYPEDDAFWNAYGYLRLAPIT